MTVKKINRSHRMVCVAGMLALAVFPTSVPVQAGEGNAQTQKKNVFQRSVHSTYSATMEKKDWACAAP